MNKLNLNSSIHYRIIIIYLFFNLRTDSLDTYCWENCTCWNGSKQIVPFANALYLSEINRAEAVILSSPNRIQYSVYWPVVLLQQLCPQRSVEVAMCTDHLRGTSSILHFLSACPSLFFFLVLLCRGSAGYCFVELADEASVDRCVQRLNGKLVPGSNPVWPHYELRNVINSPFHMWIRLTFPFPSVVFCILIAFTPSS